jgi:Mg/Co/Ni transporter MgtE
MLQVLTRLRRQMKNIEDRPSLTQHVAIYTQESSNRFDIQAAACVYTTDPSNKKQTCVSTRSLHFQRVYQKIENFLRETNEFLNSATNDMVMRGH